MSLAVPKGEQVAPATAVEAARKRQDVVPDIPATLRSLAGKPITGEGQWRVVEKVNGEPAILTTFLRDATYTSYVDGVASIDQRLVRFYLRPGYEDPGYGNWKAPFDVPSGSRAGLLATFNGGFKISDAGGGFYLNGAHYDALVNGAASIVYYKNGTIKIGQWGRDFTLNASIAGVRQNLKLLVDRARSRPTSTRTSRPISARRWAAVTSSGAPVSASPATAGSSTSTARLSTCRTWPSCCAGRARSRACRWTSTPPG